MKVTFVSLNESDLKIKYDRRKEVFNFGEDNAFPSLVELLIKFSPTSKTCVDRVSKAMYGKAFGKIGKVVINSKGQTLNAVLRIAAREYAKHNNVFIHVNYNYNYDISNIEVIPVKKSRIGKVDGRGYSGKFLIYDNWDKKNGKKINERDFFKCDKFNFSETFLNSQIGIKEADTEEERRQKLIDFNGQLIHIKQDDSETYSLSDMYGVMHDAIVERNSKIFRCNGSNKGFLNTKIVVVPPFQTKKERKVFKATLKSMQGAENTSEVIVLESEKGVEDISKQMFVGNLTDDYNDKIFEYSDKASELNICKSFGVHISLVNPADSGVFGNSGAQLLEAKKQLYQHKEEERNKLEEVFQLLMGKFENPIVDDLLIIDPYAEAVKNEVITDENAKAQATLRGSVGGVTALILVQEKYASKLISYDEAIAVMVYVFGFEEDIAKKLVIKRSEKEDIEEEI